MTFPCSRLHEDRKVQVAFNALVLKVQKGVVPMYCYYFVVALLLCESFGLGLRLFLSSGSVSSKTMEFNETKVKMTKEPGNQIVLCNLTWIMFTEEETQYGSGSDPLENLISMAAILRHRRQQPKRCSTGQRLGYSIFILFPQQFRESFESI
ncbi:hypothetical protein LXL04_021495 [Taraxacum kok-saghyz]